MRMSIAIVAVPLIFLSGCRNKPATEKGSSPSSSLESAGLNPIFAAPDSFNSAIGRLYDGYNDMESALAQDDFTLAKDAFQSMHGVLHLLQKDGLDSAGKIYWDSLNSSIMEVLHPMASTPDIAGMRDHLLDFTPLILDAVEKFGASSSQRAYLFHCPMARNNQGGDWLQRDTVLANPYLGKSMASCGIRVREVKLL